MIDSNLLRVIFLVLLLAPIALLAAPLSQEQVPDPLKPWIEWVLQPHKDATCPSLYNNNERQCAWPSRLRLALSNAQGSFAQEWDLQTESWVTLPGDAKAWPQDVTVNGEQTLVSDRTGKPAVRLPAGQQLIEGKFLWDSLPESLTVPPESGLIHLSVEGIAVSFPDIDKAGRIWLRDRNADRSRQRKKQDRLGVKIFRRLIDDNPMRIVTRLQLEVSGSHREIIFDRVLLEGFIPLAVKTKGLPARLESDGKFRVQVRPGRWTLEIIARHHGDLTRLSLSPPIAPWPEEEIWVFDARNHLRLVKVEDAVPVDPRQTNLPPDWHQFPAYRMHSEGVFVLQVLRRGDPEPEPDKLSLRRNLWLDFDGKGYTLQDKITGVMTSGWRLETGPELHLGQAKIDGQPQFITTLPGNGRRGVEVRRGAINLAADSRHTGKIEDFPAVGWNHDFQQVRTVLHLPPGWKLFSVSGTDNIPRTWLQGWTLLDLFLVLVSAIAAARLWSWTWGVLALITLGLIWHEPNAPQYVWLNLLAATALLRVLPVGRLRASVTWYRLLSFLALVIIALPFLVQEVRVGLYPQLERPWLNVGAREPVISAPTVPRVVGRTMTKLADGMVPGSIETKGKRADRLKKYDDYASAAPSDFQRIDPNAVIQTGPGLPNWQWTPFALDWYGPVERDHYVHFVFLSPVVNLVLNLLRVLLIMALALRMFDKAIHRKLLTRKAAAVGVLTMASPLLSFLPQDVAADVPSQQLLDELESRLLEQPECRPQCAQYSRMYLTLSEKTLTARLEVHAAAPTGVPLPVDTRQWAPSQVLLDGAPATGLKRMPGGQLWLYAKEGRHQIVFSGRLPTLERIQLPLPLKPHRVEVLADGWSVEGIRKNGIPDQQIQFTRQQRSEDKQAASSFERVSLPPLVRIERTLRLGLDWQVETRVVRVSPKGAPVVLRVPLIIGESVTTEGMVVKENRVSVNMSSSQSTVSWLSTLEKTSGITLIAADDTRWSEVWRADISPIWHATLSGIPVVHHQDAQNWLPEWRPWPGEEVKITVSRPEGIEGKTLTIDRSILNVTPGKRATDASLELTLRSSQGGQHQIILPETSRLQSVSINGTAQPVRQEGRAITLPVTPGKQNIQISWRKARGIQTKFMTPLVDLGIPSVNATVKLNVNPDRWVLFVNGPRLGPAVLFWGVLIVIVLVAFVLGRVPITPLRTHQWLLLGIGLSQSPIWLGLIVVGWLIALGARANVDADISKTKFNLIQFALGLLTLIAVVLLFDAVRHGLLGSPQMQIAGNQSSASLLNWYQDRVDRRLPTAWAVSVPLVVYRFLMLAWALWLALALVRWLRWAWQCFSTHGVWREVKLEMPQPRKTRKGKVNKEQTVGNTSPAKD